MLKLAVAQIAPVFMNRKATLTRIADSVRAAGERDCRLVVFGEALVPGYPVWLARTDGARFDDPDQKRLHAQYIDQAVACEAGHLEPVCAAARDAAVTVVLGIVERPADRGGHSLYCARVIIDELGALASVHRKLMPTYEERLAWGIGDGAGLLTHRIGDFTLGALNCWENWMPLARAALYGAGEDLHVALWPGSVGLTRDITRFIALESRSFVVSVGGVLRASDIPDDFPLRDRLVRPGETLYDGGSCIAGPDGAWVVEPVVGREGLIVAELDPARVRRERQNFDPAGHYARPDVLRLVVDRRRQSTVDGLTDDRSNPP